jgi:hypothetical protein
MIDWSALMTPQKTTQNSLRTLSRLISYQQAGSLRMNTALEYSRVVQEGGRRCKKSTLNDLVHLTPLRMPLMNPPNVLHLKFNILCVLLLSRYCIYLGGYTAPFPSLMTSGWHTHRARVC